MHAEKFYKKVLKVAEFEPKTKPKNMKQKRLIITINDPKPELVKFVSTQAKENRRSISSQVHFILETEMQKAKQEK